MDKVFSWVYHLKEKRVYLRYIFEGFLVENTQAALVNFNGKAIMELWHKSARKSSSPFK